MGDEIGEGVEKFLHAVRDGAIGKECNLARELKKRVKTWR
jgi:hypothetical protein